MKITKAKLVKGTFLEVSFADGDAITDKSYPHTEAPPKLLKAFMSLNHHLCELTEQYDKTGQLDFDNVACRGYSMKGDGEKEGFTLTGVRSLSNGKTLTIPSSPFVNLESDGDYHKLPALIQCLDRCREEIAAFMENNKSPDEIQGKLFDKNNTFIVKSEQTAKEEEQDLPPETRAVIADIISEQEKIDDEMPLNQEMLQAKNARENKRKSKK
jgi:hypothetical protein